jgi:hypothetical protein
MHPAHSLPPVPLTQESTIQVCIKMPLCPMPPPVNITAPINAHSNIYSIKILLKIHTLYTLPLPITQVILLPLILILGFICVSSNLFLLKKKKSNFVIYLCIIKLCVSRIPLYEAQRNFFSLSIKYLNRKNVSPTFRMD